MADVKDLSITGVKRIEATTAIELETPSVRDKDGNRSLDENGNLILAGTVTATKNEIISVKATTPQTITATQSGTLFTNEGATEAIVFTLPTAIAGYVYTFYVQDADGITVTANTGDTIRTSAGVTAGAGSISSTTAGSVLKLVSVNATEWVSVTEIGTRA